MPREGVVYPVFIHLWFNSRFYASEKINMKNAKGGDPHPGGNDKISSDF